MKKTGIVVVLVLVVGLAGCDGAQPSDVEPHEYEYIAEDIVEVPVLPVQEEAKGVGEYEEPIYQPEATEEEVEDVFRGWEVELSPEVVEEVSELLVSIPWPGIDARIFPLHYIPIELDETGLEIMRFINRINGWWGPPRESFHSPDQAELGFVSLASFWLTTQLQWETPDEARYHPELSALTPYFQVDRDRSGSNRITLHSHIEETSAALFGQRLTVQPGIFAPVSVLRFYGIDAYVVGTFGIGAAHMPIVLSYEAGDDGHYIVTCVFMFYSGGFMYPYTWEEIPEDELVNHILTVADRHTITLERNQDGGFYYWAHILPPDLT